MATATYNDVLLGKVAYGAHVEHEVFDLAKGGQFGWSPVYSEWQSNQAYVPRNLICIVLRTPGFFKIFGSEADKWRLAYRNMFEVHARKWEGFNATLTAEFADHQFGGGGNIQEELVDMKRERSSPKLNLVEKRGAPFQTMLDVIMRYGGMDPETKFALTSTLPNFKQFEKEANLPSWYTGSAIWFEPDINHSTVLHAWVGTNLFPKTAGQIDGVMDKTSGRSIRELDVEWTAITEYSRGAVKLAQALLNRIKITNADPYQRDHHLEDIEADDWLAAPAGYGVDEELAPRT